MTELNQALIEIGAIRRQMARTTEFRGYGPATLLATGVLAVLAAVFQSSQVTDPAAQTARYLGIWIGIAVLSAALTGAQMYTRTCRIHSGLSQEMLATACEQFLPSAAAGMLVTLVLARYVPAALWMLPGLWQIVLSLGLFSSCRFLPRPVLAAGVWYLSTGLFCLALGGARALSPWAMGIPFSVGQWLLAGVLLLAKYEVHGEA